MQRLMQIVTQLRSPAIGASDNLSHDPEALTLYVLEEAQDVLDALQSAAEAGEFTAELDLNRTLTASLPDQSIGQAYCWEYCQLSSLALWLLWGTVRSSHEVMQLMEGRTASCLQPDQTWQPGMLRLVPLLSLRTADAKVPENQALENRIALVDLATGQLFTGGLAADRLIQFDSILCPQPVAVAAFVDSLSQQIQITTPILIPFLQGISTELLIPGDRWQTGVMQLCYALEFTTFSLATLLPPPPSLLRFKFADSTWLEQYQTLITEQQLTCSLSGFLPGFLPGFLSGTTGTSTTEQPFPALSALVAQACHLSEQLHTGWTIASRNFVRQELSGTELAMRLHWCLIHSAYEVMQLLSGVRATVWVPQSACQTGRLRFLIVMRIQTPTSEWVIDLATGQILEEFSEGGRAPLPPDAIVQSQDSPWCHQPTLLGHLETMIWQHIHCSVPEMKLLLQGTEIDLFSHNPDSHNPDSHNPDSHNPDSHNPDSHDLAQNWQAGVMHLQGSFISVR
jgi:hypothetical protein